MELRAFWCGTEGVELKGFWYGTEGCVELRAEKEWPFCVEQMC